MFKVLRYSALVIFVIGIFIYSGCSEDSDPLPPSVDHFKAIGVYLSNSGIKAASILRGVTSDTLVAQAGVTGDHLEVQFYNDDEEIVDPPSDPDHTLSFEVGDTTIAGVYQHPGEEGGYEFHLTGKKAGITYIELFILHEGHWDYRSGKIPLKVVE
ncbi:MAG: hypothetical protein R6W90_12660 [Ignavibacteriaceae bacterium]